MTCKLDVMAEKIKNMLKEFTIKEQDDTISLLIEKLENEK